MTDEPPTRAKVGGYEMSAAGLVCWGYNHLQFFTLVDAPSVNGEAVVPLIKNHAPYNAVGEGWRNPY